MGIMYCERLRTSYPFSAVDYLLERFGFAAFRRAAKQALSIYDPLNHPYRIATYHRIVLHILRDDRSCTDYGILA